MAVVRGAERVAKQAFSYNLLSIKNRSDLDRRRAHVGEPWHRHRIMLAARHENSVASMGAGGPKDPVVDPALGTGQAGDCLPEKLLYIESCLPPAVGVAACIGDSP
jgi:hypothetical protein